MTHQFVDTVAKSAPGQTERATDSIPETAEKRAPDWTLLHLLAGPSVFAACLLVPLPAVSFEVRGAIGLLVWMAWWWIARPVHLAVTGFLPLAVAPPFELAPVGRVLGAYSEQMIILLVSANVLTSVWTRWGLDRRIALRSLLAVGTGTTRQILVWFVIAMALSTVLPNTIVAASMIPIVVAMLRFLGIEDLWNSRVGTALVLAVAWGTSAGGAATPLGGAPNLLTVSFIEEAVTGQEFLFMTWVTRFLPLTAAIVVVMFVYIRVALRPELAAMPGSRLYFGRELNGLGAMKTEERWGLLLLSVAALLAFARPLYAEALPGLTPAFAFLLMALLSFVIRRKGEPLMRWPFAQQHMMWGLFYIFAGGIALGRVLTESGAADQIASALVPYARGGGFTAVAVFAIMTMLITQVTSNTAAIAIVVPVTISTFQSLGMNPVPFVYIVTAVGNCGFALPSSSGGPAVAAGYDINLKTMAVKGLVASLLVLAVLVVFGYLLAIWWPGFGEA